MKNIGCGGNMESKINEENVWNVWRSSVSEALKCGDKDKAAELLLIPYKAMSKIDYKALAKNLVSVEPLSKDEMAKYPPSKYKGKIKATIKIPEYDEETGKVMCGDVEVMPKTKHGVIVAGADRSDLDIVDCDIE